MSRKTKIEWCDATWNPITGCLHGCDYCYARKIAKRFGGCDASEVQERYCRLNPSSDTASAVYETSEDFPPINAKAACIAPYPFGFQPTLHLHLLNQPSKWKKPKRIFVCSMADLFGDWVPDQWIEAVFDVCRQNPQHQYLFLTKNPDRYYQLGAGGKLPTKADMPHLWFGTTITNPGDKYFISTFHNTFLSIEPIQSDFQYVKNQLCVDWVIAGAETGNRKDKFVPSKESVLNIISSCYKHDVPLFMKDSLVSTVGEDYMRRQFPDSIRR